jgi:uncharacterized protein
MKKYCIRSSSIDGRGIFLTRDVKKDETIFLFSGEEQIVTSGHWFQKPNSLQIGYAKWLVPKKGSVGNFLNHCCSPSSGVKGKNRIVAMRDLQKGEEVTIDYSLTETYPLWHMFCRCGAKNCRKLVKPYQDMPTWRMKKYIAYTSRYILDMKMHLNWNEYLAQRQTSVKC